MFSFGAACGAAGPDTHGAEGLRNLLPSKTVASITRPAPTFEAPPAISGQAKFRAGLNPDIPPLSARRARAWQFSHMIPLRPEDRAVFTRVSDLCGGKAQAAELALDWAIRSGVSPVRRFPSTPQVHVHLSRDYRAKYPPSHLGAMLRAGLRWLDANPPRRTAQSPTDPEFEDFAAPESSAVLKAFRTIKAEARELEARVRELEKRPGPPCIAELRGADHAG